MIAGPHSKTPPPIAGSGVAIETVIPGRAKREPGISQDPIEIPDQRARRVVRNDNKDNYFST